jgi:hypothetical protein
MLTAFLCSSRGVIIAKELHTLYKKFGLSEAEALGSRRMAALTTLIGLDPESKARSTNAYKQQLQLLRQECEPEPLISLDDLMSVAFSADPVEREQELAEVYSRRQNDFAAQLGDNKKKAELLETLEARKKKMLQDFDTMQDKIHMDLSNFTRFRYEQFCELVQTCKDKIEDNAKKKGSNAPRDIVSFLGLECFPPSFQKEFGNRSLVKAGNKSPKRSRTSSTSGAPENGGGTDDDDGGLYGALEGEMNLYSGDKQGYLARAIRLAASATQPRLVDLLTEYLKLGNAFAGMSFVEVIKMLQSIAATKIGKSARGFVKRWRYSAARHMWTRKHIGIKGRHFVCWAKFTHNITALRKHCLRKLKAWQWFTKRMIYRRELFRLCFWPFFTWRKSTNASAACKEKVRFLVHRVIPTFNMLHVFRAWKRYHMVLSTNKHKAADNVQRRILGKAAVALRWLHRWAGKRKRIRYAWKHGGKRIRSSIKSRLQLVPLVIWKTYAIYVKIVRERAKTLAADFRNMLFTWVPERVGGMLSIAKLSPTASSTSDLLSSDLSPPLSPEKEKEKEKERRKHEKHEKHEKHKHNKKHQKRHIRKDSNGSLKSEEQPDERLEEPVRRPLMYLIGVPLLQQSHVDRLYSSWSIISTSAVHSSLLTTLHFVSVPHLVSV